MKFATCLMVAGLSSIAACGELDADGNPIAGEGSPADTETVTGDLSVANMNVGEYLFPGQRLTSSQCYYSLRMQGDGNLVAYAGPSSANPMWSTHTAGYTGAYAALQRDGNLVVYSKQGNAKWASHTEKHANVRLRMQDDGNVVIYQGSTALWASHTERPAHAWPCDQVPQSETTFVEPGFDRPGKDYKSFGTLDGLPRCGAECATDSKCVGFTYVPSGIQDPVYGICYLKDSLPPAVADSRGLVSGVKLKAPSSN